MGDFNGCDADFGVAANVDGVVVSYFDACATNHGAIRYFYVVVG